MARRLFSVMVMLGVILSLALPVLAQDGDPGAKAVAYLKTVQNDDGGFPNGYAPESDISTTADGVVALVVGGADASTVAGLLDYLDAQVSEGNVATAGLLAKTLTAVSAAEEDAGAFGVHNLVEDVLAMQGEDGLFGSGAFDHCLVMLALQNAGEDLPEGTVEALLDAQGEDGGWGFMASEKSDTNTTAICLQALAWTDHADAVAAGLAYLEAIQNEDGGWPYQSPSDYGTDSDANSTALVIQALVASHEDLEEWNDPQQWLLGMQLPSGGFSYQEAMPGENILATVAAIPALEGVPLNAWAPDCCAQ